MVKTGKIQIDIKGEVYETELTENYIRNSKYTKPNNTEKGAFIPGLISEVLVSPGQIIKEGRTIIILEAMKMLNEINLNFEAKITEIFVSKGDIVVKDQILFKYERID